MLVPDSSLRNYLETSTETYSKTLLGESPPPNAVAYLKSRGLTSVSAASFRLGYVESPLTGHEAYRGMLSIPYLTRAGVTTIRFRACPSAEWIAEHGEDFTEWKPEGPKYRSMPGDEPRLFNPNDLSRTEDFVCLCEGEFDAITAHAAGLPAVAVQGVSTWRDSFSHVFAGYKAVYVLADSDDKGQGHDFAERVCEKVRNARSVPMPPGHDVNSLVVEQGPSALLSLLEDVK